METRYVAALGVFDGVHKGHAALLERAKAKAAELGVQPAVMTFTPHPDSVVRGEDVELIVTDAERERIIRQDFGIDQVVFISFDRELMNMDWRSFADMLAGRLHVVHFIVGYDFRFGHRGEGSGEKLAGWCRERGLGCDIIPQVTDHDVCISSTYIRRLLKDGEMERACEVLGRPYRLSDTVQGGRGVGRTMGTPTVNIALPQGVLAPRFGVYATRVCVDGQMFNSVTNIGIRPTFADAKGVTVESFILDFDRDIYGRDIAVYFYKFLRPERKFSGAEELSAQIMRDAGDAGAYLKARFPD